MNKKRRKILTVNDQLEPQQGGSENQPILALTFYTSDNQVLEHTCLDRSNVTPPSEWKDLTGTIEIEEGVTGIASEAFRNFAARTYIVPNTLAYIGDRAFMSSSVQTIDLTGLDNCVIGGSAFAYCRNLTSIHIPAGTTNLRKAYGTQSGTFDSCTSLTSVTFGNSEIIIGDFTFESCTNLNLSSLSVKSIGQDAFLGCSSITDLRINFVGQEINPVIGAQAFAQCTNLETVTITGKTNINTYAFSYCSNLTSINLGPGCRTISSYAFNNCPKLKYIYLDQKSQTSGSSDGNYLGTESTFNLCPKINEVYLADSTKSFGLGALVSICGGKSIFSKSTEPYNSIYKRQYSGKQYSYQRVTDFSIPEGTTSTPKCLANYIGLIGLGLPTTLTTITAGSFSGCSIRFVACYAQTPPSFQEEYPFGQSQSLTIYVPKDSVNTYKQAEGWSNYTDKIIEIRSFGIDETVSVQENTAVAYITITNIAPFDSIDNISFTCEEGITVMYQSFDNSQVQDITGRSLGLNQRADLRLEHTMTEEDISAGTYTFRGTLYGKIRNLNVSKDFEATVNLQ